MDSFFFASFINMTSCEDVGGFFKTPSSFDTIDTFLDRLRGSISFSTAALIAILKMLCH